MSTVELPINALFCARNSFFVSRAANHERVAHLCYSGCSNFHTNFGAILEQFWSNFGAILEQFRHQFQLMLPLET